VVSYRLKVSCPVPSTDCPWVVAGNYNIFIGSAYPGDAVAAAADRLIADVIGCTSVGVCAVYADGLA